jgi:hypothetical protein
MFDMRAPSSRNGHAEAAERFYQAAKDTLNTGKYLSRRLRNI